MKCITVADLKKALQGKKDSDVVVLKIYDENEDEYAEFTSDIDRDRFYVDSKFGKQTADGDRDIIRLHCYIDLS